MHFPTMEIIRKLRSLQPGFRVTYHIGFLEDDRKRDHDLDMVATVAYDLYLEHRVLLVQRRIGHPMVAQKYVDWTLGLGRGFEYIAVGAYPKKLYVPFITNPLHREEI